MEEVASSLEQKLRGDKNIKVISHTDADGIASASILAKYLYAHDIPFAIRFTRPLKFSEVAELARENYDIFVFLDQGSSQIAAIHKFILGRGSEVVIIDHHPGELLEHPNLVYLNPHACELNGARDISASGAVYSVVEQMDRGFRHLLKLAIVGAIGDRQEYQFGFSGVNDVLVKRAKDLGFLRQGEGLRLIGRTTSPIVECLRLSTRPYIPGISGNLEGCRALLDLLGIPSSGSLDELGSEGERRLRDEILTRVGDIAVDERFRDTLWGTTHAFTDIFGPKDARDQVAMLDACGDLRQPELGFAAAMGDEGALSESLALMNQWQEQMLRVLTWLSSNLGSLKLTPRFRSIYFGKVASPTMVGEALSLALESGFIALDRPLLGFADSGAEELKASMRSTHELAARGIDVGRAMARAAEAVGGEGGGHDVAAAARIPRGKMDEFLTNLDRALSEVG